MFSWLFYCSSCASVSSFLFVFVACFRDGVVCLLLLCVFAAFCYLDCRTRLWFALFTAVVVLFVFGFAVVKFVGMLYCWFDFVCLLMFVSLCLFVCCGSAFAHM